MSTRVTIVGVAFGLVLAGVLEVPTAARQVVVSQSGGQLVVNAPPDSAEVGTGAISGVVTDRNTGQPIADALVSLSGAGRGAPSPQPRQQTDARGRFIFTHLPAFDSYVLSASKQGYFDGRYKETPGINATARLALRDGQWFTEGNIELSRPAAISGTIVDEHGDPLVGIAVRALTTVQIAGRTRRASGPVASTDDRGMYRLSGLLPGDYLVHVPSVQLTLSGEAATAATEVRPGSPSSSQPMTMMRVPDGGRADLSLLLGHFPTPLPGNGSAAYPMMYYPAARSIDQAAAVTVAAGQDRSGIDIQMPLVPTVVVSGHVIGSAESLAKIPVRLVPAGDEDLGEGAEAALTVTDASGAFTLLRVPEGDYSLIASTTQAGYSGGTGPGISAPSQILPSRAWVATSSSAGSVAGSSINYRVRSAPGDGAFGQIPLSVGRDNITDLAVPLMTGVVVSGHYLWDGSPDPPAGVQRGPLLRLEPANGDLTRGMPFAFGGMSRPTPNQPAPSPMPFEIQRVLPGRYTFGGSLVSGEYEVESIEHAGRDLLRTPLEVPSDSKPITGVVVRLTSRKKSLTGYVRTSAGNLADSGAVLIFPTDPTLWRDYGLSAQLFKTATITSSGDYRAPAMIPGEYFLAAVTDAERERWTDPEFLETLAIRATRVRLTPGANLTQDLQLPTGGGR